MAESELLPVLVRLASHVDPRVASFAAGALANLAENVATHASIVGSTKCIPRIGRMLMKNASRGRTLEWLLRGSMGTAAVEDLLREREDAGGLARPGGPGAQVVDNIAEAETAVQRLQAALVGQTTAGISSRAGVMSSAVSGAGTDVAALAVASSAHARS